MRMCHFIRLPVWPPCCRGCRTDNTISSDLQFYKDVVDYDLGNCYSIVNDPRNAYMQILSVE